MAYVLMTCAHSFPAYQCTFPNHWSLALIKNGYKPTSEALGCMRVITKPKLAKNSLHSILNMKCMFLRAIMNTYVTSDLRKSTSMGTIVTRFEKSHLPHTQEQDTLFTIKQQLCTLTYNSARYWCWKLSTLLLLWFVSKACQTSLSAQVTFKMAPYSFDKQTASCNSPHDLLMSLAIDLFVLCDMWRWKWHQFMSFGCI